MLYVEFGPMNMHQDPEQALQFRCRNLPNDILPGTSRAEASAPRPSPPSLRGTSEARQGVGQYFFLGASALD
jgi:hypothetical protein